MFLVWMRGLRSPWPSKHLVNPQNLTKNQAERNHFAERKIAIRELSAEEDGMSLSDLASKYPCPAHS